MELNELTIHELSKKLREGETTSVEITESVFNRIDAVEDKIHSFITIMKDSAFEEAQKADKAMQ